MVEVSISSTKSDWMTNILEERNKIQNLRTLEIWPKSHKRKFNRGKRKVFSYQQKSILHVWNE